MWKATVTFDSNEDYDYLWQQLVELGAIDLELEEVDDPPSTPRGKKKEK